MACRYRSRPFSNHFRTISDVNYFSLVKNRIPKVGQRPDGGIIGRGTKPNVSMVFYIDFFNKNQAVRKRWSPFPISNIWLKKKRRTVSIIYRFTKTKAKTKVVRNKAIQKIIIGVKFLHLWSFSDWTGNFTVKCICTNAHENELRRSAKVSTPEDPYRKTVRNGKIIETAFQIIMVVLKNGKRRLPLFVCETCFPIYAKTHIPRVDFINY